MFVTSLTLESIEGKPQFSITCCSGCLVTGCICISSNFKKYPPSTAANLLTAFMPETSLASSVDY
eukprot:1974213-Amphidinium_carterae.1